MEQVEPGGKDRLPPLTLDDILNAQRTSGRSRPPVPRQAGHRSTGRVVAGGIALCVAALLAILGTDWFRGFTDLYSDGNPFSGILALLGLGAWVVAAAFLITGIVLLAKSSR